MFSYSPADAAFSDFVSAPGVSFFGAGFADSLAGCGFEPVALVSVADASCFLVDAAALLDGRFGARGLVSALDVSFFGAGFVDSAGDCSFAAGAFVFAAGASFCCAVDADLLAGGCFGASDLVSATGWFCVSLDC
jgi:hypothetical protein